MPFELTLISLRQIQFSHLRNEDSSIGVGVLYPRQVSKLVLTTNLLGEVPRLKQLRYSKIGEQVVVRNEIHNRRKS